MRWLLVGTIFDGRIVFREPLYLTPLFNILGFQSLEIGTKLNDDLVQLFDQMFLVRKTFFELCDAILQWI